MTRRSANPPDYLDAADFSIADMAAAVAMGVLSRPRLIGGAVVAATMFGFFGANAALFQTSEHPRALFATRLSLFDQQAAEQREPLRVLAPKAGETHIRVERQSAVGDTKPEKHPDQGPRGDAKTMSVQSALSEMGLYTGEIDGLEGPKTEAAIIAYQKALGTQQSGRIDGVLLEALNLSAETVAAIPAPKPRPQEPVATTVVPEPVAPLVAVPGTGESAARIARIQAGLRAFGHDQIDIDGVVGSKTRAAITEFQALFRIAQTGEPSVEVEKKMREIGLLN
jgi:peptidoglycan hydrolase-like protein with peptidoglycan-binding domain